MLKGRKMKRAKASHNCLQGGQKINVGPAWHYQVQPGQPLPQTCDVSVFSTKYSTNPSIYPEKEDAFTFEVDSLEIFVGILEFLTFYYRDINGGRIITKKTYIPINCLNQFSTHDKSHFI